MQKLRVTVHPSLEVALKTFGQVLSAQWKVKVLKNCSHFFYKTYLIHISIKFFFHPLQS